MRAHISNKEVHVKSQIESLSSKLRLFISIIAIGAAHFATADDLAIKSAPIAGPENAPIRIEEFLDFQCPYCTKGSQTIEKVLHDFSGKVSLVIRNLPLPGHPHSAAAAKAFTAVALQSPALAFKFQEEVFNQQARLATEGEQLLFEVAENIGANLKQMKSDMNAEVVAKILENDKMLAQARNIRGTPSFVIGTETVIGARSYPEIKSIIEKQLAQSNGPIK